MKTNLLLLIRSLVLVGAFLLSSLNAVSQNVNIPDANFKNYLLGNGLINTNADAEIQTTEAAAFAGGIDVSYEDISDLTGIKAFTALTSLRCSDNQLTSLNVSTNTALSYLDCSNNQLTSLDVSANTALTVLECSYNQLTSLLFVSSLNISDLTGIETFTTLTYLKCSDNQLTSLDVSANKALTILWCYNNQLTSLDVSANAALTELWCFYNQLTSLDVSANTALAGLFCRFNQLTSIDVSDNLALTYLYCSDNQLTSLDVSANRALTTLDCGYNQLTSLNVQNGNNTNFMFFFAGSNPNLTCIQVDDAAWATANLWAPDDIDATASFSVACTAK